VQDEVPLKTIVGTSQRVRRKSGLRKLKREIVAAASAPGASVSAVARRYDANAKRVFMWRTLYAKSPGVLPAPQPMPVMVTTDHH